MDVGGGHGQNIKAITATGHKLTILGSRDICSNLIQSEIDKGKIEFNTGSFLSLPYLDNSFDVIITYRTLSHMEHWESFIDELCRVASHLVVIDYPTKFSVNIFPNLFFSLKQRTEKNTRRYLCFSPDELSSAFNRNGFRLRKSYKQFLLPMAAHRLLKSSSLSRFAESLFRILGLTRLFGSPVIASFSSNSYSTPDSTDSS